MAKAPLQCWWGDLHVAQISPRRPWDLRLRYSDAAQERWDANTPALSCSLPVQRRPLDASNFLQGLLPEGRHLQAVAHLAGVATNDSYGLLARYGRDVAGALVITPDDNPPSKSDWSVEPYTDETLALEIAGLDDRPLGVHPDSELSLAGLQNKLLLVKLNDGRWGRPVHGHPSTHILKVDDERYPGLVAAEADCLRLARSVDLADGNVVEGEINGKSFILVRRYDRADRGGTIERLHQEDACQALGIDPGGMQGRAKYESAGGPSFQRIAGLLRAYAQEANAELMQLLRIATFTVAIGNADAHGKNISFLHDEDGHIRLAPVYDTVPTILWPNLRQSTAMSVDGKRSLGEITQEDLVAEAARWGVQPPRARSTVKDIADALVAKAADAVTNSELLRQVTARAARLGST